MRKLHRENEYGSRTIYLTIWQNLWPVLGLMILNFFVGYTDVYVAGLLSANVQAAVGFVSQQYFLLIILGNALGVGTVALVSQAAGKNDWSKVLDLTRQTLILTGCLGLALFITALVLAPLVIRIFDLPASVRPMALTYLRIYAVALLPNYIIIVAGAVFRAIGRPLVAFQIMIIVTALNIAVNFGLVFGLGPFPRLGYPGIALATALSMSIGSLCVVFVLRRPSWIKIWREPWRISRAIVTRIFRISWPAVLLQIAWNAGNLAIYQFLARLGEQSVSSMAAYANGLRLEAITYLPAFAFNMAAAVLVGQSVGAGSVDRARWIGWRMAAVGSLILSALSVVLFVSAPTLATMLTSNADVWAETVRYLRVNLIVAPLMISSMVLGGAMQGAGDTRGVMVVIVLAIWVVRIPLAAVLCFWAGMGALGVWIAMDISMTMQAALMTWRFSRGAWYKLPMPHSHHGS